MSRKRFFHQVALPVASLVASLALLGFPLWMIYWGPSYDCKVFFARLAFRLDQFLFAESGVCELAAAVLFAVAGCAAFVLWRQTRNHVPGYYRLWYFLVGLGGWFVALEELSYGQHLVGWKSPGWFARHNYQHETNVHNLLSSKPSGAMRTVANAGFPLWCLLLPLCYRKRGYRTNHWTHYLLPRLEVVPLMLVMLALAAIDHVGRWWLGGLYLVWKQGEVKEVYWSWAALLYVGVLRQRLVPSRVTGAEADRFTLLPVYENLKRAAWRIAHTRSARSASVGIVSRACAAGCWVSNLILSKLQPVRCATPDFPNGQPPRH